MHPSVAQVSWGRWHVPFHALHYLARPDRARHLADYMTATSQKIRLPHGAADDKEMQKHSEAHTIRGGPSSLHVSSMRQQAMCAETDSSSPAAKTTT